MIIVLLLSIICKAKNIGCSNSACTSCNSGYLYNSLSCLPLCPTGFTQSSSPKICTNTTNVNLFQLNFWNFYEFAASSIDQFQHPSGLPFQDPNRQSPIPTIDRGFYFADTSSLVSTTNFILAPDFSLRLWINIKTDGTIFEAIGGGISYINIASISGVIVQTWYFTNITGSYSFPWSTYNVTYAWTSYKFTSTQSSGLITLRCNSMSKTYATLEFRAQISDMIIYIGGTQVSFTGFIFQVNGDNSAISNNLPFNNAGSCDYNEIIFGRNCAACPVCSGSWPWCIRINTCSICYSDYCSECTGFDYPSCTACTNSKTPPDCVGGVHCNSGTSIFNCLVCSSGYTLIGGLCLLEPYLYDPAALQTPVIDVIFDDFQQFYGGIFQSGNDPNTWAPFGNPDADDPIPSASRGLYFDGLNMYLASTVNIALNYECSFAIWIYNQVSSSVVLNSYIAISSQGGGYIKVRNPTQVVAVSANTYKTWSKVWIFYAFSVKFSSSITCFTYYVNQTVEYITSKEGYAFYSVNETLWIARPFNNSAYTMFQGFIYRLTLWQTVITDFSSTFDLCGSGLNSTCVWPCKFTQYYNPIENECSNCDTSCTSGCATWGTCNSCSNPKCTFCTNFNDTCTLTIDNPCNAGYVHIAETGHCCDPSCADCYEPYFYTCSSCNPSAYLLAQVCVDVCPLGYAAYYGDCLANAGPFLNVTFNQIQDRVIDSIQGIAFGSGIDNSFYPSGTSSDPIPAKQRGYYFTGTSYMASQSIILPYNFTMVFYIKQMQAGTLLSKSALSIGTSGGVTLSINSMLTAGFAAITSTNWMVIAFNLSTSFDGTTTVSLSYPPGSAKSKITANAIFMDYSSPLILGDPSTSFLGFIYQFVMYTYPQSTSTLSISTCSSSTKQSCVWNCDINQYLSASTCTQCSTSCSSGCVRSTDCDLCADSLCSICSNFTAICTTCTANASLISSNTCACNIGFYETAYKCAACPARTYSLTPGTCLNCYANCLSCSGPSSTSCVSCLSNASLQNDHSCTCNQMFYWDSTACSACGTACLVCVSPSICSTCVDNAVMDGSSVCSCDTSYFWDGSACSACFSLCKDCIGSSSTQCTGCFDNASVQTDGSCACDSNFYLSGASCIQCDSTCLECYGGLDSTCTSCASTLMVLAAGTCTCAEGYYWTGLLCQTCYSQCLTCTGPGDTKCSACVQKASLQSDGSCVCESSYFAGPGGCSMCYPACASCTGASSSECTECVANAVSSNNQCSCIPGYYFDGAQCSLCGSQCNTCSGPSTTDCLDCYSNAGLQLDFSCKCDSQYYWSGTMCEPCDASCLTCVSSLPNGCTGCTGLASLQSDSTCVCDSAYFWTGLECSPCDSSCLACDGIGVNQCTECTSGLLLSSDKACVCSESHFWDASVSLCKACDTSCASCSGSTSGSCTGCAENSSLVGGFCTCNAGWYWDGVSACGICYDNCEMCTGPAAEDCVCMEHASLVGKDCVCETGFYRKGSECEECDITCLTCSGPSFYECTSCAEYLLEVVCVGKCPVGFDGENNACALEIIGPSVEYVFTGIEGVLYDTVSHIGAITGESEAYYPVLDSTDPLPTYERGIYFTGEGSYLSLPYPSQNILLFNIRFSISSWINIYSANGSLFYKSYDNNIIFSAIFENFSLKVTVRVDGIEYYIISSFILTEASWNSVLISINYNPVTSVSISINTLNSLVTLSTNAPFMDSANAPMIIGSTTSFTDYFQGFIYSIAIYLKNSELNSVLTTACDACAVCPLSGICIPSCNITAYYSNNILECLQCNYTCVNGCRNSEDCNLCYDSNCVSCSNYDMNHCNECVSGYEVLNGTCVNCSDTEYYDSSTKTCEKCTGLCQSCLSSTVCISCVANTSLSSTSECICDKGYSGNSSCVRNYFTGFLSINSDNQPTLSFSEPLMNNLTINDVLVIVQGTNQSCTLSYIDQSTYFINCTYTSNINEGDMLIVKFTSSLESSLFSLLDTRNLTIGLFATSYDNLLNTISEVKSYSQQGMTIGLSAALGTSAVSLDPASFFTFLNFAEIYSYIVLYQIEIDPTLVAFLNELQFTSKIPNIFTYFIDQKQGVQMTGKISDYGNNTNLFLLNSGVNLTILCCFIIVKIGLYILRIIRNKRFNTLRAKIEGYFTYKAFLRLWIQSCLDFSFNSAIGIYYMQYDNRIQYIDFTVCCAILVIFI